jgi:hypothetical protein
LAIATDSAWRSPAGDPALPTRLRASRATPLFRERIDPTRGSLEAITPNPPKRLHTFCAGDDIKDFLLWTDDDPGQARQYQETAQTIEDLDAITIARDASPQHPLGRARGCVDAVRRTRGHRRSVPSSERTLVRVMRLRR